MTSSVKSPKNIITSDDQPPPGTYPPLTAWRLARQQHPMDCPSSIRSAIANELPAKHDDYEEEAEDGLKECIGVG